MDKNKFRLKVLAVALLVASPIMAVVVIAQRPDSPAHSHTALGHTEHEQSSDVRLSHK